MYRFEKLIAWQKAMDYSVKVYEKSRCFPKEELFGLTAQLRRATTSMALNIAEGSACKTKKEFTQFLYIALRSQYEVITILILSRRLEYLNDSNYQELTEDCNEIGRLVQALINSMHG